ncbi:MAG TPA: GntG family PLP-dependent aldolase [Candidatus Deferrimicrobiaceae bacterium]|nr:GntG family PLP-dependent aldolase [Candidatus Deferrimicrobiaceae bacterium]
MRTIDLRSDTVTTPTPEMRRAMAAAEVGDDVFGDDPTVIALEERAAELLGKEAGLFVASGTMGNLVSLMAHLDRGQEVIAGRQSHLVLDEAAGHAVVVGASVRAIDERPDGTLDPAAVRAAFRDPTDEHHPITGLVTVENGHAHTMNQPLTPAYTAEIAAVARAGFGTAPGVPLHVDGSRFWNAVVALGVSARELAAPADSLTFCLSKGLGCPIGSVVVGSRAFIWRTRRARKLLGGGMRQVGVVAAAGLVALRDGPAGMIERLADDHANARRLAEALAELDGVVSPGDIAQPDGERLDPGRVRTNFVVFRVERDRAAFIKALAARGVLLDWYPHEQVRAVTHQGIERDDIETVIVAIRDALAETSPPPGGRAVHAGATA